jgi:hypothetical protein
VGAWCAGFAAVTVPFGSWWILHWHHLLTTSATVKNAEVSQTIADRFGGYFTLAYGRYLWKLASNYLTTLEPWSFIDRLPYANRGVGWALASLFLTMTVVSVAVVGGVFSMQRWRRTRATHPAGLSTEAWALGIVGLLLALKALLDLIVAPLWAESWYATPERLAAGFLVGGLAWVGVVSLWQHHPVIACVPVAVLVLALVPVNTTTWQRVNTTPRSPTGWQDQLDLAASWIKRQGPPGRYGATDAGLLGYELDGTRSVVNLDGLVNNYHFAKLVNSHASLRMRLAVSRVDYLANRLTGADLHRLGCGSVLWRSPGLVPYGDDFSAYTEGHIYVLDVRRCPAT